MSRFSATKFINAVLREFKKSPTQKEEELAKIYQIAQQQKNDLGSYFESEAKKAYSDLQSPPTKKFNTNGWIKAVSYTYATTPLSYKGSLLNSSRFSIKQPTLYLAEDDKTALKEVQFPSTLLATTLFGVNVNLQFVLDLSNTNVLHNNFSINTKLFQGPWKRFENIGIKYYTHFLGEYLRSTPIEGFLYESVQSPGHSCLCIFPDKMLKNSSLTLIGQYANIKPEDHCFSGIN